PKRLIATGIDAPSTFSNRRAGPPPLTARSAISAISRRGETRSRTRARSPSDSSAARNSERFRNAIPSALPPPSAAGGAREGGAAFDPAGVGSSRVEDGRRRVGGEPAADLERQRAEPLESGEGDGVARPGRAVLELEGDADRPRRPPLRQQRDRVHALR